MKTYVFNKNFTISKLEYAAGNGYFEINCYRFGRMIFSFDIEFNVDSDYQFDSVSVYLDEYDWEDVEFFKTGRLNKRNTRFICEILEGIISEDPEAWGFDAEQMQYEDELDNATFSEMAYYDERC